MERIAVIGSAGAGKTELAIELGRRLGLPVVHLDPIFWRAGWRAAPRDEARRALEAAIARDRWIVDGNFLEAGDGRFRRVDTVVFLDLPRRTCLRRVFWRRIHDRRRHRPDLPVGAQEGLDRELLRWIWTYRAVERPRVLELLTQLGRDVAVYHLRSPAGVRRFLASV